jgi:hypothetical protein
MAKGKTPTVGEEQEALLKGAIQQLANVPLAGARGLPELIGLHAPPKPVYRLPQDNVILTAINYLTAAGRVYAHGDDIVYESDALDGAGQSLIHLRLGRDPVARIASWLANVFTCADGPFLFPPPNWFANILLTTDLLLGRLPRIRMYARRPVFDENFHLCSPGWHPSSGVLVHGPAVEPVLVEGAGPDTPALDRLPPHLRTLLAGFCFRSDADLVNAVAMFLTGVLANHFINDPKGVFLIDGNQPGLGKSLLVRCVGSVLDGTDPRFVTFIPDDVELEKKICAQLRGSWQSMVFIDNAKSVGGAVISSQVIEANSVAAEVSLRILGKSEMYTRPNDLLWAITMNDTRLSPDLTSRGVPVRLAYEGLPEDRTFTGPPPLKYAEAHRLEILGELAGMVVRWNQAGRPKGGQSHRSHEWAAIVGGVLQVAGCPEFLTNTGEAAAAFNVQLDELAALAEAVVALAGPYVED